MYNLGLDLVSPEKPNQTKPCLLTLKLPQLVKKEENYTKLVK